MEICIKAILTYKENFMDMEDIITLAKSMNIMGNFKMGDLMVGDNYIKMLQVQIIQTNKDQG